MLPEWKKAINSNNEIKKYLVSCKGKYLACLLYPRSGSKNFLYKYPELDKWYWIKSGKAHPSHPFDNEAAAKFAARILYNQ